MLISTSAIVLKTIPYGDTSIIARLFTEEEGKISVIAKGAWRPKKTVGVLLEPMKHIHIQYYNKNSRDIQILKDVSLIHEFSTLRSQLDRIILGQVIIEILDKSTPNNNPLPILYRLVWRVLNKMNDLSLNYWQIFAFYLYQLSIRHGFMPNLTTCSQCSKSLKCAAIDNRLGELICDNCAPKNEFFLDKDSLVFLQKLEKVHLDNISSELNNSVEMFNAIHFLEIFTCIHIEGMSRVRSLDMVKKLLSK